MSARVVATLTAAGIATVACGGFQPKPIEGMPLLERAQTLSKDDLTVTVAVPTVDEARELFDSKLDKKRVQPVWIQIENDSDERLWFPPISVDRDYFPPLEVAWRNHRTLARKTNRSIDQYFYAQAIPFDVEPGETVSGFVFTNLVRGRKLVPLQFLQDGATTDFEFIVPVPGFSADHTAVDFLGLYDDDQWVDLQEADELDAWVRQLPCCTTNEDGARTGDPINFVVVEPRGAGTTGFVRAGWDETAQSSIGAAIKMAGAAMFGRAYRNAPMSSLYLFGRPQDIGLQKARWNVHQRNHLRLWLAPVTYRGDYVWVGQISRDIGTRLTVKSPTLTTHKIDPDVDAARDSLIAEMLNSRVLAAFAAGTGVGAAPPQAPRQNLTGDPWFTDGRRAVLFLSNEPVANEDIEFLRWDLDP